jgi:two-component system, cell cycle sensor histidine kinase and response regulator CckA
MGIPLRVLVVEDSEVDTMLTMRELRRGGFEPSFERVETSEAMAAALNNSAWDVIISDYALPQFGGAAALVLFQQKNLDIPFIIVSGAMGEERAVEMMKAGAHDYVLKHNLARLAPAVSRELDAAEQRRIRRQNEATMAYLASIVSSCQDAIVGTTLEGIVVSWNAGAEVLYGYTAAEMIGKSVTTLVPANRPADFPEIYRETQPVERVERFETVRVRKDESLVEVSLTISPLKDPEGKIIGASTVSFDISKRKREEAEWMKLIQELTDALAHVKTLSGLLPICASCKKIRDDKGYWQQVETYIKDRSDADFTHGICPECVKRLYPEYQLKSTEISAAPN